MSYENEFMDTSAEPTEKAAVEKFSRKPFQIWEVNNVTYRLRLDTASVCELEQKYKTNLMNLMGTGNGGMPALSVMLDVTYAAMKKYTHGIKKDEINSIFDDYISEGGSQLSFYTEIYMGIFTASGFFSSSLTGQIEGAMKEAQEVI